MSTDAVAVLGFVALFALMLLRVPVGMAMGLVGVSGFGYLVGGTPALKLVGQTTMRTVTTNSSTSVANTSIRRWYFGPTLAQIRSTVMWVPR